MTALPKKHELIVATRNEGKLREIKALLAGLPLNVTSLKDYPSIGQIPETGRTFKENALIKARTVHRITGHFVLADDSGLECDDLGDEPGIHSARFAGPHATDEENNQKLIQDLKQVHDPSRHARYVCALALIDPMGRETLIEETCNGLITFQPSGTGGFGYDPYFYLSEKKCTMAELPLKVKNELSHRGKALKKLHALLERVILPSCPA